VVNSGIYFAAWVDIWGGRRRQLAARARHIDCRPLPRAQFAFDGGGDVVPIQAVCHSSRCMANTAASRSPCLSEPSILTTAAILLLLRLFRFGDRGASE
jgi:hypothetical protein